MWHGGTVSIYVARSHGIVRISKVNNLILIMNLKVKSLKFFTIADHSRYLKKIRKNYNRRKSYLKLEIRKLTYKLRRREYNFTTLIGSKKKICHLTKSQLTSMSFNF